MEPESEDRQSVSILLARVVEAQSNNEKAIDRLDTKFDQLCQTLQQYITEVNNSSKAVDKFGVILATISDRLTAIERISHEPPCRDFIEQSNRLTEALQEIDRLEKMLTTHIKDEKEEKDERHQRWSARIERIILAVVLLLVTGACACLWSGLKLSLAQ